MADIVTLEEYKSYKGKTKNDDDGKIAFLIPVVSDLIKAYIGRDITADGSEPIEEYISLDYDTDTIFTSKWPIASVISVTEMGRYSNDSTVHIPLSYEADYILSDDKIIRIGGGPTPFWRWPRGPNGVLVTYTVGNPGSTFKAPEPIRLAAIELISYYLNSEYIQNKTIMGTSISYNNADDGLPKHVTILLDQYKGRI